MTPFINAANPQKATHMGSLNQKHRCDEPNNRISLTLIPKSADTTRVRQSKKEKALRINQTQSVDLNNDDLNVSICGRNPSAWEAMKAKCFGKSCNFQNLHNFELHHPSLGSLASKRIPSHFQGHDFIDSIMFIYYYGKNGRSWKDLGGNIVIIGAGL